MAERFTERLARVMYGNPEGDGPTEREVIRDGYATGYGLRRKPPAAPAALNPYERGAASPLGGEARRGQR